MGYTLGNKSGDTYELACVFCGATARLLQYAHRNHAGFVTGYSFVCQGCDFEGKVVKYALELKPCAEKPRIPGYSTCVCGHTKEAHFSWGVGVCRVCGCSGWREPALEEQVKPTALCGDLCRCGHVWSAHFLGYGCRSCCCKTFVLKD